MYAVDPRKGSGAVFLLLRAWIHSKSIRFAVMKQIAKEVEGKLCHCAVMESDRVHCRVAGNPRQPIHAASTGQADTLVV